MARDILLLLVAHHAAKAEERNEPDGQRSRHHAAHRQQSNSPNRSHDCYRRAPDMKMRTARVTLIGRMVDRHRIVRGLGGDENSEQCGWFDGGGDFFGHGGVRDCELFQHL